MLTINTNLSSLIVQSNLKASTNGLNTAIERMTSGFKINHAKDNAANYSINTKLGSKLSSYNVAQDNALMGLDMMTTAMESLDLLSSHLSRIRNLAEQAANGTNGEDSLQAIQKEVDARLIEGKRIISNTEYNEIKLFQGVSSKGKFIEEISALTEEDALAQGYTVIKTADELQAIKDNLNGKFILMNDIDLSGYAWEAIGDNSTPFEGEFDGNGYVISNLTINKSTENYQGLFGNTSSAVIKNLGLENVDVVGGYYVGGLVGRADGKNKITNCYSTGVVSSNGCLSFGAGPNGEVIGGSQTGGLIGFLNGGYGGDTSIMESCFSECNVSTAYAMAGGLVGCTQRADVINCYATGDVQASRVAGGLIGKQYGGERVSNCYALGDVAVLQWGGGFVGSAASSISNCYSTGNVTGNGYCGGFCSYTLGATVQDCYTTSAVSSRYDNGSFIGLIKSNSNFINCTIYSSINSGMKAVGENKQTVGCILEIVDGVTPPGPKPAPIIPNIITFQIGIDSKEASMMSFDLEFTLDLSINIIDAESARASIQQIDELLAKINKRQTEFGSAYSRLESALESISVSIDNLTSTQSTIRDADIAEESSEYIRNQILQQAAATLLATANQTPAIALQLL